MVYPFRNVVFEGGGVKGLAYAGALTVLEKEQVLPQIKRVGGASAGAIAALLTGLGLSANDISRNMMSLDFTQFCDNDWGVFRDLDRLLTHYGWNKGECFRQWADQVVAEQTGKTNATFGDIASMASEKGFKEMYFVATNLSTGNSEVFSAASTPDMPVADAVRRSMSIPLFFQAVRAENNAVYVDGGVLANYPVRLFDHRDFLESAHYKVAEFYQNDVEQLVYNQETLGFRLDSSQEIKCFTHQTPQESHTINNFYSYVLALIDAYTEAQEREHLHSYDWHRTVYIDSLGVKTTQFDITDEEKNGLIASGAACTEEYFRWYTNPENQPANRP